MHSFRYTHRGIAVSAWILLRSLWECIERFGMKNNRTLKSRGFSVLSARATAASNSYPFGVEFCQQYFYSLSLLFLLLKRKYVCMSLLLFSFYLIPVLCVRRYLILKTSFLCRSDLKTGFACFLCGYLCCFGCCRFGTSNDRFQTRFLKFLWNFSPEILIHLWFAYVSLHLMK